MIWDDAYITGTFEDGCRAILQSVCGEKAGYICYVPEKYNRELCMPADKRMEFHYYPMGDNGEPDWKSVKNSAKEERPDLFWYRYPDETGDIRSAREFCNNVGAYLVEDCSHLIVPEGNIGKKGDIVLWNLKSMGLAHQGAIVVCANPKLAVAAGAGTSGHLRKVAETADVIKLRERSYCWKKYRELCRYLGQKCDIEEKRYDLNVALRRSEKRIDKTAGEPVRLSWDVDADTWNKMLADVGQSTLTQEWNYGEAKRRVEGWSVKRALLYKGEQCIGLLQILIKYHIVVRINRGPLLAEEYRTAENVIDALDAVKRKFGTRLYLFQPELNYSPEHLSRLVQNGYTLLAGKMQESAWVDLQQPEEALRGMLKSRWRNQLTAAEKTGMTIQEKDLSTDDIIKAYKEYMEQKSFRGIPPEMLGELLKSKDTPLITYSARNRAGELLAFNIAYVHGTAATYLIGWMNDAGRKDNANNYLLYHMMLSLKETGIRWFDLGGIDDIHTEQIAKFKRGINGMEYELCPECRAL